MADWVVTAFYVILAIMLLRAFTRPSVVRKVNTSASQRMVSSISQISTFKEFNETIKLDKLTFVDFYATWCGPCKTVAPVLEDLSKKYPTVQFRKVDVDEAEDLAIEYGVTAMPTFILFKKSEPLGKVVGANVSAITNALERYK